MRHAIMHDIIMSCRHDNVMFSQSSTNKADPDPDIEIWLKAGEQRAFVVLNDALTTL
jgi:hypothetical protein